MPHDATLKFAHSEIPSIQVDWYETILPHRPSLDRCSSHPRLIFRLDDGVVDQDNTTAAAPNRKLEGSA